MEEIREIFIKSIKEKIENLKTLMEAEKIRVDVFGKNGMLKSKFKEIKKLPPEKRAEFGKILNDAKREIESLLSEKIRELKRLEKQREIVEKSIDLTLPGARRSFGKLHPISQITQECVEVFSKMGFKVVEGPEIETSYYNFEALNTPEWHPARDLHDTFYVDDGRLLRTHTSPVQIRTMESQKPPLRIVSPGRVYRKDYDASHLPAFFQIEGFAIDKDISIADLKGTLENAIKSILGKDKRVRFRPHYFPFTEPSIEVDVSFPEGKNKWLELLGAGMIHPQILRNTGIDPNEWQGFAFGMGIERIAMLKYGIDDIREFPRNYLGFLKNF